MFILETHLVRFLKLVSCIFLQLLKNSDTSSNYSFIFTYFSMWLANCFPVDIDKKNQRVLTQAWWRSTNSLHTHIYITRLVSGNTTDKRLCNNIGILLMFEAPYEGRKALCRNSWQVLKPALSYGFYVPGIDEMKSGILWGKKLSVAWDSVVPQLWSFSTCPSTFYRD